MFGFEILAVQISMPPHLYYFIILYRRQEKAHASNKIEKLSNYDGLIVSRWCRSCRFYVVTGTAANFTGLSGGNLVDGLPPASN